MTKSATRKCLLDEERYEPFRPLHVAGIVPAQPRQQGPLFHVHSISERDTEEEKQYQYRTPRLRRQTQSDERDQDPGIRRVADQPVGTILHNLVVFRYLNCQREEAAQDRDRILADENPKKHQKDPDIENPVRKRPYASVSEVEGDHHREEHCECD